MNLKLELSKMDTHLILSKSQVKDSIHWVRCASGNVFYQTSHVSVIVTACQQNHCIVSMAISVTITVHLLVNEKWNLFDSVYSCYQNICTIVTLVNLAKNPRFCPPTPSRLPCYVFYLCMLTTNTTNKDPNANKLSWVIN